MVRRFWLLLLLVLVSCQPAPAWALDPAKYLSQYGHTAWRLRDGLYGGNPVVLTQTQDGYLWLGTSSDVLRFDGVRFESWRPPAGEQLPSRNIHDLIGARDGSLWISSEGGLSRWQNGHLTNYRTGATGAATLLEDHTGTIWFLEDQPLPGSGPLCQVVGLATRCYGAADGIPSLGIAGGMAEDAHGNIWFGGARILVRWSPTSHAVYQPDGLKNNSANGIGAVAARGDTIWVGISKTGPGLGLQQVVDGQMRTFRMAEIDGSALFMTTLFVDSQRALWIGTFDRGLYRLHGDRFDHYDSKNGLSSDTVWHVREDHEGNIWVTTNDGVDRFTDLPVVTFSEVEGLCSPEVDSVLATRDGRLWVGGDSALSMLVDGRMSSCLRKGDGLPGAQVTSTLEDHAGRLWVGVDDTLSTVERGTFHRITKRDGSQIGFVTGLAEDADGNIWVAANGPPRTLMRIRGGQDVEEVYRGPPLPRRVAVDPTGGLWLGLISEGVAHYHDGQLVSYPYDRQVKGTVNQLLVDADGSVLAATTRGLMWCQNGKSSLLTAKNGLPCDEAHTMTFDGHGSLWLSLNCGLTEVTRADLQRWHRDPAFTLTVRTLDVLDGVHSGFVSFNGATRTPDGRLWFGSTRVLQMIDPAHLRRNTLPPPVHIGRVVADRIDYPTTGTIQLPPLTRDLEIDYVGLSFSVPQKVFFRYWLEGRDTAWEEPGTRRQAFYSDLRPGTYRFRVIASNNDGLWNEEGAVLAFTVAPAWYQTRAFLLLCIGTGLLAVWIIYRLRLRQVARVLTARFDERLAERTRVARDLHDTLLQTVQGSKMIADDALTRPGDAAGLRRAVEQLSKWLGQASTEGRAAVQSLRISTMETNDLAEAFRRAIEDCRRQGMPDASLTMVGDARRMHPMVRDEVYRIGYEAIRNACTHSGGSEVRVTLTYAQNVTLHIADNGSGIEQATADTGKAGHFGLQGMRERAARIGGKLTIVNAAGSGTEIALTVPGRVIFLEQDASLFARLRSRLSASAK